jgi:hypothetical protein
MDTDLQKLLQEVIFVRSSERFMCNAEQCAGKETRFLHGICSSRLGFAQSACYILKGLIAMHKTVEEIAHFVNCCEWLIWKV